MRANEQQSNLKLSPLAMAIVNADSVYLYDNLFNSIGLGKNEWKQASLELLRNAFQEIKQNKIIVRPKTLAYIVHIALVYRALNTEAVQLCINFAKEQGVGYEVMKDLACYDEHNHCKSINLAEIAELNPEIVKSLLEAYHELVAGRKIIWHVLAQEWCERRTTNGTADSFIALLNIAETVQAKRAYSSILAAYMRADLVKVAAMKDPTYGLRYQVLHFYANKRCRAPIY